MDFLGPLTRAVSTATDLIGGATGIDLGAVTKSLGSQKAADYDGDSFGFDDASAVFDQLFKRGLGGAVNEAMDRFGLPDVIGDVVGTVVDLGTMNFVGASLNGLDASENILRATGHEELAGYIDAALPIADTVVGIVSQAALMACTGGGSAAVSVGGMTTSVSSIMQTVSMIRGGLDAGAAWEKGDYFGAATAGFGAMANFGGLGDMLGMSPDTLSTIADVAQYGGQATGVMQGVMADGKVDLSVLQHVPVLELLGGAGLDTSGKEDLIGGLVGFISGSASDDDKEEMIGSLADTMINALLARGAKDDAGAGSVQFLGDILKTGAAEPDLLELLGGLLKNAAAKEHDVNMTHQHASRMRV